jgi:hypothetical protein
MTLVVDLDRQLAELAAAFISNCNSDSICFCSVGLQRSGLPQQRIQAIGDD